jgi:uncharacterized protein with HEPN domain
MKNQTTYLNHILDAIKEIEIFSEDKNWKDAKTERAIERCIEIIGEAANNLSKDFQKKFPEVEWSAVIGMRHKIIHDYFEIDPNLVKSTVEDDIPTLKKQIQKILKKLESKF